MFSVSEATHVALLEINSSILKYVSIKKEDIMIMNWCVSKNILLNYIKWERTEIKGTWTNL